MEVNKSPVEEATDFIKCLASDKRIKSGDHKVHTRRHHLLDLLFQIRANYNNFDKMVLERFQRSSSCNNTSPEKITKRRQTSMISEDAVDLRRSEPRQENLKLCELVKASPCLYDSNHIKYGNKEAMEAAWKSIAEQCGQSETWCRKRYNSLRAAYGSNLKAYKNGTSVTPYYLHKHLDFLKPFISNERGRKSSKSQRETVIEILSDDSNDSMVPAVNEAELEEERNINETELEEERNIPKPEEHSVEPDALSDHGSRASSETTICRKRTSSISNENLNAKRSLITPTTELEDKCELEPKNEAQNDIIILQDKEYLNCILYAMQDMNKRQKHMFKAKIWENVHIVLDSDADYPNNCNANKTRHNKNHSDSETVMQQIKFGIARLNEGDLREMQQLIKQREREIENCANSTIEITDDSGVSCDNNVTNASDRRTPIRGSISDSVKQEPTSTDQYMPRSQIY